MRWLAWGNLAVGAVLLFVGWSLSADVAAAVVACVGAIGLVASSVRRLRAAGSTPVAAAFVVQCALAPDLRWWAAAGGAALLAIFLAVDETYGCARARRVWTLAARPHLVPVLAGALAALLAGACVAIPVTVAAGWALSVAAAIGVLLLVLAGLATAPGSISQWQNRHR